MNDTQIDKLSNMLFAYRKMKRQVDNQEKFLNLVGTKEIVVFDNDMDKPVLKFKWGYTDEFFEHHGRLGDDDMKNEHCLNGNMSYIRNVNAYNEDSEQIDEFPIDGDYRMEIEDMRDDDDCMAISCVNQEVFKVGIDNVVEIVRNEYEFNLKRLEQMKKEIDDYISSVN